MRGDRPKLVVSACFTGDRTRYDGKSVEDQLVRKILTRVEVVKVCPEVSVGLGVPREKIILLRDVGGTKAYQPATGRDLTGDLRNFSRVFISKLRGVDGFLLKAKSPSCGVFTTKTYKDHKGNTLVGFESGLFARETIKRYVAVEDEIGLRNRRRLIEFLARVDLSYRLRRGEDLSHLLGRWGVWVPLHHKRHSLKRVLMYVVKRLPSGVIREFLEEGVFRGICPRTP